MAVDATQVALQLQLVVLQIHVVLLPLQLVVHLHHVADAMPVVLLLQRAGVLLLRADVLAVAAVVCLVNCSAEAVA